MRSLVFAFLCVALMTASCVTRKKVALFQSEQELYRSDTFQLPEYEFHFSPGDIVSIRVGSLTNSKFDFINRYALQLGEHLYLSPYTGMNNTSQASGANSRNMVGQQSGKGKEALPVPQVYDKSVGFQIRRDGTIVLPEIGNVPLSGLTIREAENVLEQKLKDVFEAPFVRVQVLNFQFTINGEVGRPGKFTSYKPKTTLVDALAMAGSFTEFADRGRVKIVRRLEEGYVTATYVNLLNEDFLSSPFYYVHPNDMIFVEPLKAKAYRNYGSKDISTTVQIVSTAASITAILLSIFK
ncbi:MAG: polysaccharide biosynthesis/export family protein [Cytophagales bacterium]|nr:polysaccharide biosynthesis/export family protein [Cytophagales bacterium]